MIITCNTAQDPSRRAITLGPVVGPAVDTGFREARGHLRDIAIRMGPKLK